MLDIKFSFPACSILSQCMLEVFESDVWSNDDARQPATGAEP